MNYASTSADNPADNPDQPQLKQKLQAFIQNLNDLSVLEEAGLDLVQLQQGEILFAQGDPGESMYVLVSGMLGVRRRHADGTEAEIDRLSSGAAVGELALLSRQNRSATVYALEDSRLLRLNRREFEELSATEQHGLVDMEGAVVKRWRRLQLSQALHKLFGQLDTAVLHELQGQLPWYHLSNGDILFRQDDPSDGMYIVLNGRLRFTVTDPDDQLVTSHEIGPGETVGEYALITAEPRSATVFAVRESNLVKITPAHFANLSQSYPQMMPQLTRIIVARQQRGLRQNKPVAPAHLTLAIVPLGDNIPANIFARELAVQIEQYGKTLTLNSDTFDSHIAYRGAAQTGADSPGNPGMVALLDELESKYKYLLYVADPTLSNWTRRCVGQADRVLLLADPTDAPEPGQVEQWLAGLDVPLRTELVLWHPVQVETPRNTAVWLDKRVGQLHTHHHVRQGTIAHTSRLARRLTGHAVCLVLGGGSARGFAHLGVHRALEELGIPVDYIGATSMGAVIGGAMTLYEKNEDLMQLALRYADPRRIFDSTLPFTSLMASYRVTRILQETFGDRLLEDQWLPFFCVASNLTTAVPIIYQRGSMWQAIRASIAIPGVLTPVIHDGHVIVDGGVIDNFPVETMVRLCESERIIGVNVTAREEKRQIYDFEYSISGWRILLSRLNPFRPALRAPSLVSTILRTFEINSVRRAQEAEALVDLMIHPDVKKFATTAYDECEEIVQVGYETAREPLRLWWAATGVADRE